MRDTKDTEERRKEFIDAAERLFRKNGIVDTTISSIVKEMDVAKGLFYYYFKSKDDVIDAINDMYQNDFKKAIDKAFKEDNFDERLNQFVGGTVESFRVLIDKLNMKDDDVDLTILSTKSLEEAKKIAGDALEKLLDEGNEKNQLHIEQTKYYAKMIVSGIAELVENSEATAQEIEEIIKDLLNKIGKE